MIRFFRRFLIARAIRRLLRCNARADLKAAAIREPPITMGEIAVAWNATMATGEYVSPYSAPVRKEAAEKRSPGRQTIRMPVSTDMFGRPNWSGLIQPGAHEAPWEDCHTFAKGERPMRDLGQLHGGPPIALICPGCDLAQPPMVEERRACGYCGLNLRRHGYRLFWWRAAIEVTEWKP